MNAKRPGWRIVLTAVVALCATASASAQLYPKVDYYDTSVAMLREAVQGSRPGSGSVLGSLAALHDPELKPLFEAMLTSNVGPTRVFGVLGCGLVRGEDAGVDPKSIVALTSAAERAAAVRESNATGLLRHTAVAEILACPDLEPGTIVTLSGELDRRGEAWDVDRVRPFTNDEDLAMAGVAAMLVRGKGDTATWDAFVKRVMALPEPARSGAVRALAEGALVFSMKHAVPALLPLATLEGLSDDAHMAIVGAALSLDAEKGLPLWQDRVAAKRSQPQLLRSGLQLLSADEKAVPASAFEALRNGNPALDALVDCGVALRTGKDHAGALIALFNAGYPILSDWVMVRARSLPPAESARVWKAVLETMDSANPDDRPTPVLVSLAVRELMKSDPAAVQGLVDRARTQPILAVALLSGVYESGQPQGVDVARTLRGSLPRAGESLATLVLARHGAPLSDDDLDVLGRAASGGGDLEAMRAVHAAWFLIKRKGKTQEALALIGGGGS